MSIDFAFNFVNVFQIINTSAQLTTIPKRVFENSDRQIPTFKYVWSLNIFIFHITPCASFYQYHDQSYLLLPYIFRFSIQPILLGHSSH